MNIHLTNKLIFLTILNTISYIHRMSIIEEVTSGPYYIKQNVSLHEYTLQTFVYDLHLDAVKVPKIISYDKKKKTMVMERVGDMSIADFYGEEEKHISDELFARIREIINTLYKNDVTYPDITGYNFIETGDDLWIIDFEHATYKAKKKDAFVNKFINGLNLWNPEFK